MYLQRFYLLKAAAAESAWGALALAWRGKRAGMSGHQLPYLYPLTPALRAVGYLFLEDLIGATEDELVAAGLAREDATAALVALTGETMGFTMQNGRWANTEEITLAALLARVADGDGAALQLGDRNTLRLLLDVTAIEGTTKELDVTVKTRRDSTDAWRTLGTFTQKTAVASERKCFAGLDREVMVSWAKHADTASVTFSVAGEAA